MAFLFLISETIWDVILVSSLKAAPVPFMPLDSISSSDLQYRSYTISQWCLDCSANTTVCILISLLQHLSATNIFKVQAGYAGSHRVVQESGYLFLSNIDKWSCSRRYCTYLECLLVHWFVPVLLVEMICLSVLFWEVENQSWYVLVQKLGFQKPETGETNYWEDSWARSWKVFEK